MSDRLESQLAQWSEAAPPAGDLPATLHARLRRRRGARAVPALFASAALACTLGLTVWIAARDSVAPVVAPWTPVSVARGVPDPDGLPLTPVKWAPAKSLRAGSCRDPQCVDAWLAGV